MSAFLTAFDFLYSDCESPDEFFDSFFAGRTFVENLKPHYVPQDFPIRFGSIIAPYLIDMEKNSSYLFQYSDRYSRVIEALVDKFSTAIKNAETFDAIMVCRLGETDFDFNIDYEANLKKSRLTQCAFAEGLHKKLSSLGIGVPPSKNFYFVDGACASAASCIDIIRKSFKLKKWNRVLLISIDLMSIERAWLLSVLGASARDDGSELNIVGPLSKSRRGFYQAEAACIGIFESESKMRTEAVLAVANSYQNSDSETLTGGSKDSIQIQNCMAAATKDYTIDAIKMHASGTQLGDANEIQALEAIPDRVPILAFKGQIGHTLRSSGMFELFICAEIFKRQILPGVRNVFKLEPKLKDRVLDSNVSTKINTILFNTFGFGGCNVCLVLKKT